MWSFLKKLISVLIVLYLVAFILNLKVGGKPTRDWTSEFWNSPQVQKVYRTVRDRVMAIIRKDISVEDAFKSEPPAGSKAPQPPSSQAAPAAPKTEELRTIDVERLDEKDREALERILEKSSKN